MTALFAGACGTTPPRPSALPSAAPVARVARPVPSVAPVVAASATSRAGTAPDDSTPRIDYFLTLEDPRTINVKPLPWHFDFFEPSGAADASALTRAVRAMPVTPNCSGAASYEEARERGFRELNLEHRDHGHFTSREAEELLQLTVTWCSDHRQLRRERRLVVYRPATTETVLDVSFPLDSTIFGGIDLDDDGLLELLVADRRDNKASETRRIIRLAPTGVVDFWVGSFATFWPDCQCHDGCERVRITYHQTSLSDARLAEELYRGPCDMYGSTDWLLLDTHTTPVKLNAPQ